MLRMGLTRYTQARDNGSKTHGAVAANDAFSALLLTHHTSGARTMQVPLSKSMLAIQSC